MLKADKCFSSAFVCARSCPMLENLNTSHTPHSRYMPYNAAMHMTLHPTPDDDTAAAVIAAIAAMIAPGTADDTPDSSARSAWQAGGALAAQGMPPARNGAFAAWHAVARARRAERWSGGIIGI
jgi:hypothetical protein